MYESLEEDVKKVTSVYEYKGDINEYLNKLAEPQKMICTRFHSIIVSLLFGQQIYPLIYSKKSLNILNDLNYKGTYKDIKDIESLKVEELIKEIEKNTLDIDSNVVNKANLQFMEFDKYINDIYN